jgi:SagB-type dehydrogenase family enzyme
MTEDSHDDAISANNLRSVKPSIASTGLRAHPFRYDALRYATGGRIAEEFLVNSRLRRGDAEMGLSVEGYTTEPEVTMLSLLGRERRHVSRRISLPKSVDLRMGLGEVIQRRQSVRRYTGDAMSLVYLATIVRLACGIMEHTAGTEDGSSGVAHRSTPSGGGLYPIDLHIAALRVESLSRAIFVYDLRHDELWQTSDEAGVNALLRALALPDQIITEEKASAICLLVGRPWRSMRKYGDRGMRYVFLEAGAMAEHISLAAVALGLGSVHCGSLYDDEAHEALQIDGLYEALVHSVFLGFPG